MQVSRVVTRRLWTLVMVAGPLTCPGNPLAAQEPAPADSERVEITDAQQRQLDELLTLTVPQQRLRAQELIEEYPDSDLAIVLQRLLDEHKTFETIQQAEQERREASTAWSRIYWRNRCCPLPPWNPPVGRIVNETGGPILYEQRLDGLHRSRWSGPYRLTAMSDHDSPHPFLVRFLVAGTVQVQRIMPGENYAFRGSSADGTLQLVHSAAPPTIVPGDAVTLPTPASVEQGDAGPKPAPSTESYDPPPVLEGPMIAP